MIPPVAIRRMAPRSTLVRRRSRAGTMPWGWRRDLRSRRRSSRSTDAGPSPDSAMNLQSSLPGAVTRRARSERPRLSEEGWSELLPVEGDPFEDVAALMRPEAAVCTSTAPRLPGRGAAGTSRFDGFSDLPVALVGVAAIVSAGSSSSRSTWPQSPTPRPRRSSRAAPRSRAALRSTRWIRRSSRAWASVARLSSTRWASRSTTEARPPDGGPTEPGFSIRPDRPMQATWGARRFKTTDEGNSEADAGRAASRTPFRGSTRIARDSPRVRRGGEREPRAAPGDVRPRRMGMAQLRRDSRALRKGAALVAGHHVVGGHRATPRPAALGGLGPARPRARLAPRAGDLHAHRLPALGV